MSSFRAATLLLLIVPYQSLLFAQTQQAGQINLFLVVDNSGNMRQHDPHFAIPSALAEFANGLPHNSRLGIVLFDRGSKVVLELTPTDSTQFKGDLETGLRKLNYRGARSDPAGATERAIYELRLQGRPDASRTIVLVTNGVLNLGSRSSAAVKGRWLREDLAVEAKRTGVSIFPIIVGQEADFQLALSLARTTGGEYYRALRPALLPAALAEVNERLTKVVDHAAVKPAVVQSTTRGPATPGFLARYSVLGGALVIALVVLAFAVALARRRPDRPETPVPGVPGSTAKEEPPIPSLSAVREQGASVQHLLASTVDLLAQTNSKVREFQSAVERHALSNYKVLQVADEQCFTLARECVLLLDHLDIMIRRAEQNGEPARSLLDARERPL